MVLGGLAFAHELISTPAPSLGHAAPSRPAEHSGARRRIYPRPRSLEQPDQRQRADSDEVARAVRDDVARCSDMMWPGVRCLAGLRALRRPTSVPGHRLVDSNLCISESEFAKTLSLGGGIRTSAYRNHLNGGFGPSVGRRRSARINSSPCASALKPRP
jgi:hypothetical protein